VITLGIDVGTTHTKVLALDVERHAVLALESAPTPVVRDAEGEAHRPADLLETVFELVAAVSRALPRAAAVRALSVASVGEEVVLIDDTGAPVGDAIAWYDPRGLQEADRFQAGPGADLALTRRWPPDATFSLFKLLWLRDHAPADLSRASAWTDVGDYVLHGLGGELVMDWSHASRAGAFDLLEHAWDVPTIEAAGLELAFPRLVPGGEVVGTLLPQLARRLGLDDGLALVTGGHDHLCAAFGAGLRSTRELFLSAGTSEAHLSLRDSPLEGDAARGVDQGCYVDDHTWYWHVNIHSGHFFQQWRELLFEGMADDDMYAAVGAADAAGIAFEIGDGLRLARLDAVPYDADRATLMRAVLEGLARHSAHIVARLERAAGQPYELLLVAGHPTGVPLWRELRRAVYERPMARVVEAEPTAFGAAVLAAQAIAPDAARALSAGREQW